jgi:hypothetical protein
LVCFRTAWKEMERKRRGRGNEHTLRLQKRSHIIRALARQTLHKSLTIKSIQHPLLLLISHRRPQKLPIRIKQTSKTPHKRHSHLLRMESPGTNKTDLLCTSSMCKEATAMAPVNPLVRFLIADITDGGFVVGPPLETMSFYP